MINCFFVGINISNGNLIDTENFTEQTGEIMENRFGDVTITYSMKRDLTQSKCGHS